MIRPSLKCNNCDSQDFVVEETYIPKGFQLSCEKCGCITPLIVFDDKFNSIHMLEINDEKTAKLHEDSYCGEITYKMLNEVHFGKEK